MKDMESLDISIRGVPSDIYDRVRHEAVRMGVIPADSTKNYSQVIRWALAQYFQILEERDAATQAVV